MPITTATDEHYDEANFRLRFKHAPEDRSLVETVLADAAVRTPVDVWGDRTREAHGYLAAHMLAMDVHGRDARLKQDDGQSSYGKMRERLEAELAPAVIPRVT